MKKGDAFERKLQKIYFKVGLSDEEIPEEYFDILKLLRAQHRGFKKLVANALKSMCSDQECPACSQGVVTYILTKLNARAK